MSRVIEFRYVWVFEGSVAIGEYTLNEIEKGLPIAPKTKRKSWDLKSRDEFTGLKDKNGVEIFEGDIVYNPHWICSLTVIFDDTLACWFLMDTDGYLEMLSDHNEQSTIIGNIHQNPELLEQ